MIEEPPPAIEEPKSRSWNLESFFNKTNAMPHGEQNSENKQAQDCNRRQDSPMVTAVDARAHRSKAAHDWQLDEALKRTRNMTMISVLYSDSDRPRTKRRASRWRRIGRSPRSRRWTRGSVAGRGNRRTRSPAIERRTRV